MYKCYKPYASCEPADDCHQMTFVATRFLIRNWRHRHGLPLTRPAVYPPREETAERVSGKVCLWRKFIIKILAVLLVVRNVIWWQSLAAHMTPTARNIWTCAVFATSSFNFGHLTYIVWQFCYGRALYAVFYRKICFKKSRAELLTVMSKVTHLSVCIVLTPCFALLVQLALVHLKI